MPYKDLVTAITEDEYNQKFLNPWVGVVDPTYFATVTTTATVGKTLLLDALYNGEEWRDYIEKHPPMNGIRKLMEHFIVLDELKEGSYPTEEEHNGWDTP